MGVYGMTEKTINSKLTHIKVTQIASPIGRIPEQRKTLVGLGLNKIGKERILEDTLSIRGMVNKVKHLVRFEIISGVK